MEKVFEIVPVTGWVKVIITTFKDNKLFAIASEWYLEDSATALRLMKGVK